MSGGSGIASWPRNRSRKKNATKRKRGETLREREALEKRRR
jgi:hypothetical protein